MTRQEKENAVNKALEEAGEFPMSFTEVSDKKIDALYTEHVGNSKNEGRPYKDITKVNEILDKRFLGYQLSENVGLPFCIMDRDAKRLAQMKQIENCEIRNGQIVGTGSMTQIPEIEMPFGRFKSKLETFNWNQEAPQPLTSDILQQDRKIQTGYNEVKHIYNSLKEAPQYPDKFEVIKNGTLIDPVHDKVLLSKLRGVLSGKWFKVYINGYDTNKSEISIHYFKNETGIVFNVKIIKGWSELRRKDK